MGLSAAAGNPGQAGDRGDAATDEEPHGFVGGRTGEEAREARADGIEGGKPIDHEHDARDEENDGNDTVHKWIRKGGDVEGSNALGYSSWDRSIQAIFAWRDMRPVRKSAVA